MRYAPDQKDETRRKLVREAAARMRRLGPDGVGVADIMRGVGLTHGGFYAHFASKDDLIAQAVAQMFVEGAARYVPEDALPPAERLAAFIDRYVSPAHRDRPDRGCPLATIATDIPRQSADVRAAFDAGVARITARIAGLLPDGTQRREELATSMVSEMAGAVALSRAVSDHAASDRILAAARAALRQRAGLPAETSPLLQPESNDP
jgi:TetR/AcrR family transcriptional repressor of nem operon